MSGASVQKGKSGKATLRDVAEAADCSIALASHVLNKSYGNISCTPEMLAKIERVAEELGYSSMRSRHLSLASRSYNIGVNIAGMEQNINIHQELGALEKIAIKVGYNLIIFGYSASNKEAVTFFKKKIKASEIDVMVDLTGSVDFKQEIQALVENFITLGPELAQRCEVAISRL
jgi:DNA-binding LacI/PurR family transcriptional regulator